MKFLGKDPNILDAFYKATASGSIAAGKPVIVTAPSEAKGSESEFDAGTVAWPVRCLCPQIQNTNEMDRPYAHRFAKKSDVSSIPT